MTQPPVKKSRKLPLINLLPNLVTLAAVCAGLTAIRMGFQGQFQQGVALILLAGILDGLDGRLARLIRSQSPIGAELDSLADFLNFGVAPGLLLYLWSLQGIGGLGWIAVLCFALCCLMRLARFNVDGRSGDPAATAKDYFVGIPSPAGAVLVLQPMILSFLFADPGLFPAGGIALYTVFVGFLMISRLPTYSFKTVAVSRENARFVLLGTVLLSASLLTYPWATLALCTLVYGVVTIFMALRKKRPVGSKG
ncbi:MAG: CDP-alcohol phosphatidyltransferase family protein [Qingshengfaniella sp.]